MQQQPTKTIRLPRACVIDARRAARPKWLSGVFYAFFTADVLITIHALLH